MIEKNWLDNNLDNNINYECILLYFYEWLLLEEGYNIVELELVFNNLCRYYINGDNNFNINFNYYSFIINNIIDIIKVYKRYESREMIIGGMEKIIREWVWIKDGGYDLSELYKINNEIDYINYREGLNFRERLKKVVKENMNWMSEHPFMIWLKELEGIINGVGMEYEIRMRRVINKDSGKVKLIFINNISFPIVIDIYLVEDGYYHDGKFYTDNNDYNFKMALENRIIDWLSEDDIDDELLEHLS